MLDSIALQLGVAAVVATVIFFAAYGVSQKVAASVLLILIPFQPVETRFFTANVLATYGVFLALMLRGHHIRLPMLPQILVVFFAFMLSFAVVVSSTYIHHAIYMIALVSAFMVLWISYDLTLRHDGVRKVMNVFLLINVLAAIYCFIQIGMGPQTKLVFFDNQDFTFNPMRRDNRLTGPFGATGITAEYFVIMTFVILHEIISTRQTTRRRWLTLLASVNLLLLITTGNRGGFLTLIGASLIFLWLFKETLGPRRVFGIVVTGTLLIFLTGAIAVNYTEFGELFERLQETEVEEGVPDTRQVLWPAAWREIQRQPFFGHGPRFRFDGEETGRRYDGHQYMRYPHNLYLFLLLTVGISGTLAFLFLLATPLVRCRKASRLEGADPYLRGIAKTGVVIFVVIFIDQIKLSFLRLAFVDYWHFVFALIGFLIGVCDRLKLGINNEMRTATESRGPEMPEFGTRRTLSHKKDSAVDTTGATG